MSLGRRLIGLACLLLAGCAGSQPSRELSRETLAQVIQYEDQLNNMSRVLQANYRVTANDMGNDVAWASRTSERTSRAILADDAVDKLIKDGYTEKSLRDFLEAVVAATDGSRAKCQAGCR
jgi:hypothetical protein